MISNTHRQYYENKENQRKSVVTIYNIIILRFLKIIVIMFLLFIVDIIQPNRDTMVYINAFVVDIKLHANL
jgi:hypothetical protein